MLITYKDTFYGCIWLNTCPLPVGHMYVHDCMHGSCSSAVNFWYDMEFDLKYCYFKLMENLTQPDLRRLNIHS